MSPVPKPSRLRDYLIAGMLTAIPVWITWVIFGFVVSQLSQLGRPGAAALSEALRHYAPAYPAPVPDRAGGDGDL